MNQNSNEYVVSVLLQSDDKKQSINCWMKAGEHPWEQAADDEKLTLRGAYGWHLGGGVLLECQVIKQSPKKLLNVDVDELAKQFEADPEAFHKAHNGHHILVTGKYAGHHARPGNPKAVNDEWIALEGSKGRRFHAEIGSSVYDQRPYSKIKMGEQTTIIGSLSYVSLDDLKFEDLATTATQNMTPFMPQPKTLAK